MFSQPQPVEHRFISTLSDLDIPFDSQSSHVITGVDKLHAQGIRGKGVKVGLIDTGVDYTNPVLGGGFGPRFKVIGGYDFVGTNIPVPDSDPMDCKGHGTAVAGIVGANPENEFNISGVAYEASLSMYKIFGCTGGTTDDLVIDALLRGVSDGQDILSLSLGSVNGWTESTVAVVASRIAASGKIVTIAPGNDGAKGAWYSDSPGNAINAISVGSLDSTTVYVQNATVFGANHDPISYLNTIPLPVNGTLPIFATSNEHTTITDDACDPLPDSIPDLSPYVVIVRRGTCAYVQKLTNVATKGGKVTLIYDDGEGITAPIGATNFTASLIQAADGEFLVSNFAAGRNISLSFPQTGASFQFPYPAGGLISNFSSYGPTYDMFFKPAIVAPGANILSTAPVALGGFALFSGTSASTPFIAGVSALLLGVKGNSPDVGRSARSLFETTAQRISSSHVHGQPLQTVTQQGAGLINAFKAIHADIVVSPGEWITNDTENFPDTQTFTVRNLGATSKTFNVSHIPAGTALTFQSGTIFAADGPVPLSTQYANVVFSESSFTVYPGQIHEITAHISPPSGFDSSTLPVFSGFIEIANANESYQVTYLGVAGSLKNVQVVDNTDQFFGVKIPAIIDSAGNYQNGTANYTFVENDFPSLLFRLAFGTPKLRFDLVDPNIEIQTTLNRRDVDHVLERRLFNFPRAERPGTFNQVNIVGTLGESDYVPRNTDVNDGSSFNKLSLSSAAFANGTAIPNGYYRFLVRALKVTGDPTNEADFESWLSPIVGIEVPL
ncbi:Minor extracellular protease vpr [Grifola frondosa]|uniref:Minor extracellular protease vpr n=1 Tax=Grifola frondosa TaxID=5627 RepID=A0A1C7M0Z7_GRIFR|nr:Minor extracellular protease vpr [Grifola frondosa]